MSNNEWVFETFPKSEQFRVTRAGIELDIDFDSDFQIAAKSQFLENSQARVEIDCSCSDFVKSKSCRHSKYLSHYLENLHLKVLKGIQKDQKQAMASWMLELEKKVFDRYKEMPIHERDLFAVLVLTDFKPDLSSESQLKNVIDLDGKKLKFLPSKVKEKSKNLIYFIRRDLSCLAASELLANQELLSTSDLRILRTSIRNNNSSEISFTSFIAQTLGLEILLGVGSTEQIRSEVYKISKIDQISDDDFFRLSTLSANIVTKQLESSSVTSNILFSINGKTSENCLYFTNGYLDLKTGSFLLFPEFIQAYLKSVLAKAIYTQDFCRKGFLEIEATKFLTIHYDFLTLEKRLDKVEFKFDLSEKTISKWNEFSFNFTDSGSEVLTEVSGPLNKDYRSLLFHQVSEALNKGILYFYNDYPEKIDGVSVFSLSRMDKFVLENRLCALVVLCEMFKACETQELEEKVFTKVSSRLELIYSLKEENVDLALNTSVMVKHYLKKLYEKIRTLYDSQETRFVVIDQSVVLTHISLKIFFDLLASELTTYLTYADAKNLVKDRTAIHEKLMFLKVKGLSFSEDVLFNKRRGGVKSEKDPSLIAKPKYFWDLVGRITDLGVKVSYNQTQVLLSTHNLKTDFKIKQKGSDWFELSPTVYFGGQLVDVKELKFLPGQKIIEFRGQLYKLDEKTLPQVKTLQLFWERLLYTQGRQTIKSENKDVFLVPKNASLQFLQLRNQGVNFSGDEEWQRLVNYFDSMNVKKNEVVKPIEVMLSHQESGFYWLSDLYELRMGALLADEMGLGKTLQVLAFLLALYRKNELGQCLIVIPTSLVFNWQNEAKKFTSELPIEIFSSQQKEFNLEDNQKPRVVIVTYGQLLEHSEKINQISWNINVFDEAHFVKNMNTKRSDCCRQLKAKFKVALTGTPLENNFFDFYSIVDLILPGSIGSLATFAKQYRRLKIDLGSDEFRSWVLDLKKLVAPIVLRRTKQDVKMKLPDKTEEMIKLDMDEEQRQLYKMTAISMNDKVKSLLQEGKTPETQMNMLMALMRLRQICGDPKHLNKSYKGNSPKIQCLIEDLENLKDYNESALVFVQFLSSMNRIKGELEKRGIPHFTLSGSTNRKDRELILQQFENSTQASVLIMTLKTGGVGLNLTKANHVYHFEPWWNPAAENQATDRVHRMGQTKEVTVKRLIMKDSIEEKMQVLKDQKQLQFDSLFSEETDELSHFKDSKLNPELFSRLLQVE